uniref:Uncharacterized protein n=1 Tax=Cyprinodon variegatus TaxID=28743 RepID=A0A3Q2E0A4_CYPVA
MLPFSDAESSKAESEDIELLERALEKALRVRTFSEVSKQNCSRSKLSAQETENKLSAQETENIPALTAVTKDVQPTIKSIKKPVSLHRKRDKKSNVSLSSKPSAVQKPEQSKNPIQRHPCLEAGAGNHQAARRLQQAVLAGSASPDQMTALQPKNKAVRSNLQRDNAQSKAWKAWDRWRPEGGCLCPSETTGGFRDGSSSPLPITITYRTEQELQQLERLRMRVALLQQEIYLEQVLLDTVSPHLSSIRPGPGCPSPNVLRDLYSLLGEGGQRFTAIVQDSEHE